MTVCHRATALPPLWSPVPTRVTSLNKYELNSVSLPSLPSLIQILATCK
ncbi:MAG: hypothetical protein ACK55Z_28225 [bacterium]